MTHYFKGIHQIKNVCFSNQRQLDTVIKTRHYIDENFEKVLNLDELSASAFTSKFHLLRLFKRYYGQTPLQYLTDKRLERAKELLSNGETITSTCFEVGFESPSSFCTLFKAKFGQTPTTFQKRAIFAKCSKDWSMIFVINRKNLLKWK